MPGAILVASAAVTVYLLARLLAVISPRLLAVVLRYALIALGGLVVFRLIASGQVAALLMLTLLALPFLLLVRFGKLFGGPDGGATPLSEVETPFLHMTLDHRSGVMTGTVKAGPGKGRTLADLDGKTLRQLHAHLARHDSPSLTLLEAWIDRTGTDWRSDEAAAPPESGAMSRAEACAVLGLPTDPTPKDVREAHRRLMRRYHPDVGGTDYLAAKINRAKDILLQG